MWQWWMGDGCTWGREWWLSGLWLLSWTTPGSLSRSPGWPGAKGREWLSKDGAHVGVDTGVRPWREMKGGGTIFSDAIQSTFIYVMSLILQLCDIFFLLDHCGNSSEMICLWSLSNKKLTRLWRDFIQKEYCEAEKGTSAMGRMIWPWALEVAGPWPEQTGLE